MDVARDGKTGKVKNGTAVGLGDMAAVGAGMERDGKAVGGPEIARSAFKRPHMGKIQRMCIYGLQHHNTKIL